MLLLIEMRIRMIINGVPHTLVNINRSNTDYFDDC